MSSPRKVVVTAAASGIRPGHRRSVRRRRRPGPHLRHQRPGARAGHQSSPGHHWDRLRRVRTLVGRGVHPHAVDTLGGIDVLVNNAGISGPTTPVEHLDPDHWEQVLAVNLTGTFNVTRLAIPHLKQSAAGLILIMSSLGGRFGYPNRSPYATTKRGLIGFAETLALELGADGIRTNVIAPGAVEGDRIRRVLQGRAETSGRTLDEVTADTLSIQAVKRFVDPADIAAMAVFLASERAKSISGQTIAIDGGSQTAV